MIGAEEPPAFGQRVIDAVSDAGFGFMSCMPSPRRARRNASNPIRPSTRRTRTLVSARISRIKYSRQRSASIGFGRFPGGAQRSAAVM
jgi:hypothetical protein